MAVSRFPFTVDGLEGEFVEHLPAPDMPEQGLVRLETAISLWFFVINNVFPDKTALGHITRYSEKPLELRPEGIFLQGPVLHHPSTFADSGIEVGHEVAFRSEIGLEGRTRLVTLPLRSIFVMQVVPNPESP